MPFVLKRYGSLLACNALLRGPLGSHNVELLVDTGSSHTVAPVEVLEAIGCSPSTSPDPIRITTASGVVIAPRVSCECLTIFNRVLQPALVVAHDLPFAGPVQGLLGMDALARLGARIDTANATIELA